VLISHCEYGTVQTVTELLIVKCRENKNTNAETKEELGRGLLWWLIRRRRLLLLLK
jgi:hypothetical protein